MTKSTHVEACVAAHARLLRTVGGMSEADAAAPSRLPGWSRGHVVAHLARNADSHTWVLDGARIGEVRDQYPTPGMRDADIEAGAHRPVAVLLDDLAGACDRLERAWTELDGAQWDAPCRMSAGEVPARELPFRRLREVEVHHVDLRLGYSPTDWAPEYVEAELDRALPRLRERAEHHALVAWLLDRGDAPDLTAW